MSGSVVVRISCEAGVIPARQPLRSMAFPIVSYDATL